MTRFQNWRWNSGSCFKFPLLQYSNSNPKQNNLALSSKLKLLQHVLTNSVSKLLVSGCTTGVSTAWSKQDRAGCSTITPNKAEAAINAPTLPSMIKVWPWSTFLLTIPHWAQTIHHSLLSSSSWHQQCSHKWVFTVTKPRIASRKLHGVTLTSVDQCQYLLKEVLHRKRQDMFLLGKSIPEVFQCYP